MSAGFRRPLPVVDWSSFQLSLTEREEISREVASNGAVTGIERRLLIGRLDIGLGVPNRPSWLLTISSGRWWKTDESPV